MSLPLLDYRGRADACTINLPQPPDGLRSSLFASPSGGWGFFVFFRSFGRVVGNDERTTEAV